jgi:hypothetical protein
MQIGEIRTLWLVLVPDHFEIVSLERLLLAKVLMALYSSRLERQFCERLQYDLLFRPPLVPGPESGRADLRSLDLLPEPGPAAGAPGRGSVLRRGGLAGPAQRLGLGPALQHRCQADRRRGPR